MVVKISFGVIDNKTNELISFTFINVLPDDIYSTLDEILQDRRMMNDTGHDGLTYSEVNLLYDNTDRWINIRREKMGGLNE